MKDRHDIALDFSRQVKRILGIKNEDQFYYWLGALPFYDNAQKERVVLNE